MGAALIVVPRCATSTCALVHLKESLARHQCSRPFIVMLMTSLASIAHPHQHLFGEFCLNSCIQKAEIAGVKLDGIRALGASLWAYWKENPDHELVLWKSDISEAYRLCLMNPLWQLNHIVAFDAT
jgi:hypothetical protein